MPGETVGDVARALRAIAEHTDVSVDIDPGFFRRHDITAIPVMLLLDHDEALVKVRGWADVDALQARVEAGDRGDLGTMGPVIPVAELDLIAVMQSRAATLDLEAARARARDRYWQQAQFQGLQPVKVNTTRQIDPHVVVTQPIRDADGSVLIEDNTRIDQLSIRPFTMALIVIDGAEPAQRRFAHAEAENALAKGLRPLVLLTNLDRAGGWDSWNAIAEEVGQHPYLLTTEVKDRFDLRAVPSIVTAEDGTFVVREYVVGQVQADKEGAPGS